MARLSDLLPQHEQLWLDAMARYISQTRDQAGPGAGGTGNGEPGAAEKQSEEELRKLAHERVWGQTDQQFEKLESMLVHRSADDGA
jgi:hypothetical protein